MSFKMDLWSMRNTAARGGGKFQRTENVDTYFSLLRIFQSYKRFKMLDG